MVQTENHYQNWTTRQFEDEESLKKYLRQHYNTVRTLEFSMGQTTTAANVELLEDSGETVAHAASNATVKLWQKTDQVGTDGEASVTIEYLDEDYAIQTVTVALNDTNTTTEVDVCADFFRLRKMECELLCADEILLGTTGGAAIYGVIKAADWQALQSRYTCPAGYRAFLVDIAALGPHTDASTYTVYAYADGDALQKIHSRADLVSTEWRGDTLCWELAEEKDCIFYVKKNADANHGTTTVRYRVIEAT